MRGRRKRASDYGPTLVESLPEPSLLVVSGSVIACEASIATLTSAVKVGVPAWAQETSQMRPIDTPTFSGRFVS